MEIVEAVNNLARSGKRVIVAGLDQDYLGRPFEPMPQLLSVAEFITKTHAILRQMRQYRELFTAHFGINRTSRSRRKRQIRSPLPPMFCPAF